MKMLKQKRLEDELQNTDPAVLTHTIRAAGVMSHRRAPREAILGRAVSGPLHLLEWCTI